MMKFGSLKVSCDDVLDYMYKNACKSVFHVVDERGLALNIKINPHYGVDVEPVCIDYIRNKPTNDG